MMLFWLNQNFSSPAIVIIILFRYFVVFINIGRENFPMYGNTLHNKCSLRIVITICNYEYYYVRTYLEKNHNHNQNILTLFAAYRIMQPCNKLVTALQSCSNLSTTKS